MATVSVDQGAYQDLERIRQRIDYEPHQIFDDVSPDVSDPNAALRFDELLVELERESRGIFETLWGDETPLTETDRTDTKRTTNDAAMPLVYPIQDVTQVERKVSLASDWDTLDDDWYDHTKHRLVLAKRPNTNTLRRQQRGNTAAANASRAEWSDIAVKIRVTYDRGFGDTPPADIQSVQIDLINNLLRQRKREQIVAAASPEEFAGQTETNEVVTDEIRARVADVTHPGLTFQSI